MKDKLFALINDCKSGLDEESLREVVHYFEHDFFDKTHGGIVK